MQTELDAVRAFHEAMDVSHCQPMCDTKLPDLAAIAHQLLQRSKALESKVGDEDGRYLRAHLMTEELGELLEAMAAGDLVATLDALADLTYVVFGTAVMFNLPLSAAFAEVHCSNMTKERKADDPGRIRDKGSTYRPPNLEKVLKSVHRPEYMSFPICGLTGDQRQRLLDTFKEMVACTQQ